MQLTYGHRGTGSRRFTGLVKYYPFGGRNVAMRDAAGKLHYLLADHLGGTVAVMDAGGTVVATQAYWPYGAVRAGGVSQTDKLFTGQRVEPADPAALGLYDYRARFYSTLMGRFVSADPVVSSTYDPQAWNAYSYVSDNPLRYTDPTGERQCEPDGPCNGGDQTPYDGGPAPCDALCVGLKQLAALNIFSPEDLAAYQYRQALRYCAAVGCAASSAPQPAPIASELPTCPGPSCGYPLPAPGTDLGEVLGGVALTGARAIGGAAVPLGLAVLGLVVSPCDTQYCTMHSDAGDRQTPEVIGANRVRGGQCRLGDRIFEKAPPQASHHGEEWEEVNTRTKEYRGAAFRDGKLVPKTGWKPSPRAGGR